MKTLPSTWQASLQVLLTRRQSKREGPPRLAVVGVGNPLRADDGAGMLVARALKHRSTGSEADRILILEGGQAPENQTGALRSFAPDLVVIIDAAEMGENPGTIRWIPEETIDGMSTSTHSLPLSMLAHYLRQDLGCRIVFLGIQPGCTEIDGRVSEPVARAIQELIHVLETQISESERTTL